MYLRSQVQHQVFDHVSKRFGESQQLVEVVVSPSETNDVHHPHPLRNQDTLCYQTHMNVRGPPSLLLLRSHKNTSSNNTDCLLACFHIWSLFQEQHVKAGKSGLKGDLHCAVFTRGQTLYCELWSTYSSSGWRAETCILFNISVTCGFCWWTILNRTDVRRKNKMWDTYPPPRVVCREGTNRNMLV